MHFWRMHFFIFFFFTFIAIGVAASLFLVYCIFPVLRFTYFKKEILNSEISFKSVS